MSIITLISDFGTKDYAVAAVKGRILSDLPLTTIVDVSHHVSPYNIVEAAFILNATYPNFPKNSIHIIGVNAEKTDSHKHIVAQIDHQFFIGSDNGMFSLLTADKNAENIIEIAHPKSQESSFPMLDVFVDVATKISSGIPLEKIGSKISNVTPWIRNKPAISNQNETIGHIIYVDQFGNLITDITKEFFNKFGKNRHFELTASSAKISNIHPKYDSLIDYKQPIAQRHKAGKAIAIFNSLDLLEVSIYKSNPERGGSAASLLGLGVGNSIKIEFK